jgi:thiosulfate dehydrogenase [quinone] large subunit
LTLPDRNPAAPGGSPVAARPDLPPAHGWRASMSERTVLAAALLPLRVFLGVTYVYAGVDKLASPHFFVAGDPFSVGAQLEGYARLSPLAPLIEAALPAAIPIGALIALAELAIGIGLLTGLAYRVAAWAGFALSVLFWLTASWSSTPYFFSPDLPYAAGFLTLALAGHGGLLAWAPFSGRRTRDPSAIAGAGEGAGAVEAASPGRRIVLQLGILAGLTFVAAALASSLRMFGSPASGGASGNGTASRTPSPAPATPTAAPATPAPTTTPPPATMAPTAEAATPAPTPAPTLAPTTAPTTAATPGTAGPVIASITDLGPDVGIPFLVPNEVPFAMNPGGPGVVMQLPDGRIVAYSAVCTHGRCTVAYDPSVAELVCPCHLGRFDPANEAAVLGGPPPAPLTAIPVVVDGAGDIHVVLPA